MTNSPTSEQNQLFNQILTKKCEISDSNKRPKNSELIIYSKSKSEPNSPNRKIESTMNDKLLSSVFFPSLTNIDPVKSEEKIEDKKTKKDASEDDEIMIIQESSSVKNAKLPQIGSFSETIHQKRKRKSKVDSAPMIKNPTSTMPAVVFSYIPAPQPFNPPPLWDMITNFPASIAKDYPKFEMEMNRCRWIYIDDIKLPVVQRENMELIPASVAHVKLLSQFAPNVIQNIPSGALPKLMSYKMTTVEAWMLNIINAGMCRFNLGFQIFVVNDDLVEIHAIEKYYYAIKRIHLEQLLMTYNSELPSGSIFENVNLVGAIFELRKKIIEEIKQIDNVSSETKV